MTTARHSWLQRISAIASLDDDNRRVLFAYVRGAADAVGRDEAARVLGIPRSTASFHLDRLVKDGVLQVEFRKSSDKAGPGSGRPAKLYRPAMDEVVASVPERQYDLAGDLMATAITRSLKGNLPVREALMDVADRKGQEAGSPGDFLGALADLGYEPVADEAGGYRLLNCPFHRLSQDHEQVVCAMNGAFLKGAATASGLSGESVLPDSGPGHCCARIGSLEPDPQT
ncbi:ArsR family transcriptional regulator [Arthrobacter sp. StoSoilA2]|uniref:helix-turn-helix transcriptional regulator n=1 Tax=Arthrobacter sp. StoSoilA2 TaxID=2830990 RepID=UPI001CC79AE1|nr:helix-turn-helix domain-containing protein [Arthrobacter sp. StoSoilA2]BCW36922.1 ArsR family transcriptional regulator [Arthrobacter sp. StoSoilA2]